MQGGWLPTRLVEWDAPVAQITLDCMIWLHSIVVVFWRTSKDCVGVSAKRILYFGTTAVRGEATGRPFGLTLHSLAGVVIGWGRVTKKTDEIISPPILSHV